MLWAFGWAGGEGRDLVVSIVGYRDPELLQVDFLYFMYTYRAETCSCILTVLIDELQLCLTVRVIHKFLCC